MINRKTFFYDVRVKLFGGRLDQRQVDGMNAILDEWEKRESNRASLAGLRAGHSILGETARTRCGRSRNGGRDRAIPTACQTRRRRKSITVAASCNSPGRATTRQWAVCSASIW